MPDVKKCATLLIVDDTEMNRVILTKIFRDEYEVYQAENGAAALEVLHERTVDLVLLDVMMPVMDGYEVLAAMKAEPRLADIPVIVTTAEVARAERRALELGADDFVSQPYEAYIIRKRVKNLIDRYELRHLRDIVREQKRYRDIFDLLGIAYWEWTRANGYYHSEKYEQYAINEMPPEQLWDTDEPFRYIHPDDVPLAREFMTFHPDDEIKRSAILRCLMRDGSYRWTEMFSIAERGPDDQLVRLISILRDVEKEWLEQKEKLEKALAEAKEASEAKSNFLSRVSHDMRTPLNVILSIARIVPEERPTYEMLLSYFQSISDEGTFLLRLINDVLDVQKMESGMMELHPETVDLTELMAPVLRQTKTLADDKQIEFKYSVKGFVDNAKAVLDPLRMQQLLANLLTNAVKYTPSGGCVELDFENLSLEGDIATDRITVRDTGSGMSERFMERMYEPFTQENGGSTSTTRGTGLGLSIVKRIVDLMGGTITCTSKPGEGTVFEIVIKTRLVMQKSDHKAEMLDYTLEDDLPLVGRHVLLCEDHPLNAMIVVKLLKRKGLIVTHAVNGQIGLDYFTRSSVGYYDLVLMDIRMPVMDGLHAAKAIRSLPRADAATVPILAMTANAFTEDVEQCLAAGMNEHLAKPIEPDKFWQAIHRYINTKKQHSKLKVIVVDDIEANAVVVAEAVRGDYEPLVVLSAREALDQLAAHGDVVAVITDMIMPEMDGLALIRAIRAEREYDGVALLANTQYGDREQEEAILQAGADDFIYKPTTPMVVLTRLKNVLLRRNTLTRR